MRRTYICKISHKVFFELKKKLLDDFTYTPFLCSYPGKYTFVGERANFLIPKVNPTADDFFSFICKDSETVEGFYNWLKINHEYSYNRNKDMYEKILKLSFKEALPYSRKYFLFPFYFCNNNLFLRSIVFFSTCEVDINENILHSTASSITSTCSRFLYRQPFIFLEGNVLVRITFLSVFQFCNFFPDLFDYGKDYDILYITPRFTLGGLVFMPCGKFYFFKNHVTYKGRLIYNNFYQPFLKHVFIIRPYVNIKNNILRLDHNYEAFSVLEPINKHVFLRFLKAEYSREHPFCPSLKGFEDFFN